MPVNTYETLFLLDASKVSSDGDAVRQQVHHILEKQGGQILVSREWNYNLKLAYPVEKQKKGAFHIIYYTLDAAKQTELERDFALAEGVILRQLTLRIDPKWLETILGIAREETGKEFAVRGMQDEATVTTDPAAIGGDPSMMGDFGDRDRDRDRDRESSPRRGGRRPEPAEKHD
jgi:small subunit ribosomal protein S6